MAEDMRIRRTLPPSGAPLYFKDLVSGVAGLFRSSKVLHKFENELRAYFNVKHVFLVSSGRAALTLILQSLSEITGKTEVVIPSYTCFSVPSAVVRAGLRPVICDVGENDFNYDKQQLAELINKNTLCIVVTHLFGIPCEMEPVVTAARSVGCYVVEDAAQAMGAQLNGSRVGTLGDVGFFSLGRGKCLSVVSGGIIVTNNDQIAGVLSQKVLNLRRPDLLEQLKTLCIAAFLYIFSRPSLYWFPAGLPFLGIGQTIYSTRFTIKRLGGLNGGLAANWQEKLESFNRVRREHANVYRDALDEVDLMFICEPAHSSPTYLRFSVVMGTSNQRDELLARLNAVGLGASPNYPTGVAEIAELAVSKADRARCGNSANLASRILTLPTHPAIGPHTINEIQKTLQSCHYIPDQVLGKEAS